MSNPLQVWYCIPTARVPVALQILREWKGQGYRNALLLDTKSSDAAAVAVAKAAYNVDAVLVVEQYIGWADSVNRLAALALERGADMVVTGGDDVWPEMRYPAHVLAQQFADHFPNLFGVMQPSGDGSECYDRCAMTPWVGRGFIEKTYGGKGPFWPEYFHFWPDTELFNVAHMLGCYWNRPDLIQFHDHWRRQGCNAVRPQHLMAASARNGADHEIFTKRRGRGWPGARPESTAHLPPREKRRLLEYQRRHAV